VKFNLVKGGLPTIGVILSLSLVFAPASKVAKSPNRV